MLAYFTTLALFAVGWQLKVFSPARVYDLFGEILAGLNIFSLLLCLFLYFKVRCQAMASSAGRHAGRWNAELPSFARMMAFKGPILLPALLGRIAQALRQENLRACEG